MPNKDRLGKWQPFAALEGFSNEIEKTRINKEKIEKPILMPDKLEELNEKLYTVFEEQKEIDIEYYNRGFLEHFFGKIKKIDFINKEIILVSEDNLKKKLKINLIIDIKDKVE